MKKILNFVCIAVTLCAISSCGKSVKIYMSNVEIYGEVCYCDKDGWDEYFSFDFDECFVIESGNYEFYVKDDCLKIDLPVRKIAEVPAYKRILDSKEVSIYPEDEDEDRIYNAEDKTVFLKLDNDQKNIETLDKLLSKTSVGRSETLHFSYKLLKDDDFLDEIGSFWFSSEIDVLFDGVNTLKSMKKNQNLLELFDLEDDLDDLIEEMEDDDDWDW